MKASNAGSGDIFGSAVALSANSIVVGAPGENGSSSGINGNQLDNNLSDSGAVYVFFKTQTTWSQQAYIKASNPGEIDRFGNSVAISGDTALVAAIDEPSNATGINGDQTNNSAVYSGAVYVFVRSGGAWSQQAYIKASNTQLGDNFGASVAISQDSVVIGAPSEDSSATGVNGDQSNNSASWSGAGYLFERDGSVWSQQAYLKASNTELTLGNDYFGSAVAISGSTVVVGAQGESSDATGIDGQG